MDHSSEMTVFVNVAETGNFSATARALKLTPSAVSKLIARLEDRLGARLLNRTTRRVSLTEEGRTFYQHCTPILTAIEEAEQAVTEYHGKPRGLLKVNASTTFAQYHIEPLIPDFLDNYPDLRIQLSLSESIVDLIEDEVDVAIRIGQLPDSSLIARKLGSTRRIEVDGNFETNNAVALHHAAIAGIGLIRVGNFTVTQNIKEGTLVAVLGDFETTTAANVYAVYPHNRHLSAKVRAFVDMLVEAFSPIAPWEQAEEAP